MTGKPANLKAPFPAFGGKSQIADLVWRRLGDVRNYIEPFCFSAAVLLRRPHPGKIETLNDLNHYVANFWRAVQHDPEAVAAYADWPVNEDDLHSRHRWLVNSEAANESLRRVRDDPDYFDAKIAGWWCWGACMWIGSGWCETGRSGSQQLPHLQGDAGCTGMGVTSWNKQDREGKRPQLCNGNATHGPGVFGVVDMGYRENKQPRIHGGAGGDPPGVHSGMVGLHQKRPVISNDKSEHGKGVHGPIDDTHRPQLADAYSRGRGVHGNDALSVCDARRAWLIGWMNRLADRLRAVRVCCGHWMRVCDSDSTLTRLGTTGVFLDPPYRKRLADGSENRAAHIYANDKAQDVDALCDEVQEWCLKWGDNPEIRIILCGLEGEYPKLEAAGWEVVPWKSRGGYGNRTDRGKENAARERLWLSPHCVAAEQGQSLFAEAIA